MPNLSGIQQYDDPADPYGAQRSKIARKRALAQALQSKSMQSLPTDRQVGGWAIPTSPFEGLSQLAHAYVGGRAGKKADEEQAALSKQSQSDFQAALVKALGPELAGAMGPLSGHPQGASVMPMVMAQQLQKQREAALQEPQQPQQPMQLGQNAPQPMQPPPQRPQMPLEGATSQINAPQVDVNASPMQDYQAMAKAERAKAMRVMPLDPVMGNNLLQSANALEKMGMEKDVKPIINENFPISPTQQQPHEFNRQTGEWVPIKSASARPIFNPSPQSTVSVENKINAYMPASEEAQRDFMKGLRTTYDQLKQGPTMIASIEKAKALVPGAAGFMGPGGETLLNAAKFLNNRIGTNIDTQGVKNAEELRTRIFFNIMDNLKKMDAQPSQQQQLIMQEALGKLGTDPNALPAVLDAFADVIREKVDLHNQDAQEAIKRGVKFPYDPLIQLPQRAAKPNAQGYVDGDSGARVMPLPDGQRPPLNWEELK